MRLWRLGDLTIWHHGIYEKVECGVTMWNAHAHNYTNAQTHRQRGGEEDREKRTSQKKYLRTCTSILRPSTTVPCNFSLALSASTLCSNVTNPKPCMQERKRRGSGEGRREKSRSFSLKCTSKNTSQYRQ